MPTYAVVRTCLFFAMLRCMQLCSEAPSPSLPLLSKKGLGSAPRRCIAVSPAWQGAAGAARAVGEFPLRPDTSGGAAAGPDPCRLACLAPVPPPIICPFGSHLGEIFSGPKPLGWKDQAPRLVFMCDLCYFSQAPIFCKFLKHFFRSLLLKGSRLLGLSPPHLAVAVSPVLPLPRRIGGAGLGDTPRGNFCNCRKR